MGRKKKESLERFNRKIIIDASKKLFSKKGVPGTTMDDIAAEADCSKSTIYVYFKSKDEIYDSIIYEYMTAMKDGFYGIVNSFEDTEKCYYAICNMFLEFSEKYPIYFESILGNISTDRRDFEKQPVLEKIYTAGEEINDIMISFFEKAKAAGFISEKVEPLPTAFVFWAGICGIISVAGSKEQYVEERLKMDKKEFMHYGFGLLLESIRKDKSL